MRCFLKELHYRFLYSFISLEYPLGRESTERRDIVLSHTFLPLSM